MRIASLRHRQDHSELGLPGPHSCNRFRRSLQGNGFNTRTHVRKHAEVQRSFILEGRARYRTQYAPLAHHKVSRENWQQILSCSQEHQPSLWCERAQKRRDGLNVTAIPQPPGRDGVQAASGREAANKG